MTTAVVDIGKTNLKLVVLDEGGRTVHRDGRPNPLRGGLPYRHFDVEAVWGWVLEALGRAPDRAAIEAIVPVTHGCAAALLAGDALALAVLDYEDPGPDATAPEYLAAADPFSASFTPDLPLGLVLGRQIFWQARAFPAAFGRVTAILPYPQYWAWRLSGVMASEVTSLGCHAGLWRPGQRRFSALAEAEGWTRLFPPVRPAWDALGPIRPEVAAATGLSPTCRILCGIHDSNASYLAHRTAREPPFTVLSSGTWMIVMAAGAPLARLDPARDMLANVDALGDPVPTARFMGGREYEAIAGPDALATPVDAADVARLVACGTMALPSFMPESGPFMGRRGTILGPRPETPRERAALASLYCALVSDVVLDLLGNEGPLIVEGPFAANPAFIAALAALRPAQPLTLSTDASGTSQGAARLAGWPPGPADTLAPGGGRSHSAVPGLTLYRQLWRDRAEA